MRANSNEIVGSNMCTYVSPNYPLLILAYGLRKTFRSTYLIIF